MRNLPPGVFALIAPAGEMWSVVMESPRRASALIPWRSATVVGAAAGMPSKYGGFLM